MGLFLQNMRDGVGRFQVSTDRAAGVSRPTRQQPFGIITPQSNHLEWSANLLTRDFSLVINWQDGASWQFEVEDRRLILYSIRFNDRQLLSAAFPLFL